MSCRAAIGMCVLVGFMSNCEFNGAASAQTPASLIGRASCAAATCHGGSIDRGPAWNYSLSTWSQRDPHAGAALLLYDELSRHIVGQLDPATAGDEERYDNVLRTRCISCHATSSSSDCGPRGRIDPSLIAAGVSCESCHGPAEKWVDSHLDGDWIGPKRFEPSTGMRDTESIAGRAETCVRCHVGSRSADGLVRDMNHDLIASGHPALRFDLLLYSESVPAHWSKSSPSAIEFAQSAIRVRSVGRAVGLAAAAELAGQRAADHLRDKGVPWPEFAEYDCFACHQSISDREYLLPPSQIKRSPLHISDGLPMWNSWYAINQLPREKLLLKALSPHRSDPATIASSVPRVIQSQRSIAQRESTAKIDPQASLRSTISKLESDGVLDWHEAAIVYLDLDAILRDQIKSSTTLSDTSAVDEPIAIVQRRRLLQNVEPLIRFDRPAAATVDPTAATPDADTLILNRADGPSTSESIKYQSPVRFDADEFRRAVLAAIQPSDASDNQANLTRQP